MQEHRQQAAQRLFAKVSCTLLLAGFCLGGVARGATLQEYAGKQPPPIYTVEQDAVIPLGRHDQDNNFKVGDKLLLLSGKELTTIEGISRLTVIDGGKPTPITAVGGLQVFLNDNRLSVVPEEITALQNVTFLYFNNNRIRVIPPYIAQMKGLLGMYFSENRIDAIPAEVFSMSQLKKLQVSKNDVAVMPAEIGNLTNLMHLNMSHNRIEVLPDSIAKLVRLRVCDFSHNRLKTLPEGFGNVPIMHQLRVGDNPLTSLPAGFAKMPGTIDISGTMIDPAKLSAELRAKLSKDKHTTKKSIVKRP
jgi:Leucine-rich repeat (LRR) protein